MKCFKCDSSRFKLENARLSLSVKNEPIEVVIETNVCENCGTPLLSDEHVNALRKASADQFRMEHGLLTSQQIVGYRKEFAMSQKTFAEYLGVGEASIKRWETYYIQDASQDELLRLKCDISYIKNHLLEMKNHRYVPDIFTGMKQFSYPLFKNSTLFFAAKGESIDISLLSKLHFYADFLNFKNCEKSITGTSYLSLRTGPFPDSYSYQDFESEKLLMKTEKGSYVAQEEPDMTVFDDKEKKTLHYVCDRAKAQCLIRLSQLEKAFHNSSNDGHISYEHAISLLI